MYLFAAVAAIVALIAGILLAACTKKAEGVVYGKLDKAGRITNIVLIPLYIFLTMFCIAISMFSNPDHGGFLEILGWIVCVIIASAPLSCGLGLGFSAFLRKKGRSKLSFILQFAGIAGSALSISLFMLFYGNLLKSLN
jgi:hypothetical protein